MNNFKIIKCDNDFKFIYICVCVKVCSGTFPQSEFSRNLSNRRGGDIGAVMHLRTIIVRINMRNAYFY